MTDTKHTPGPWGIDADRGFTPSGYEREPQIVTYASGTGSDEIAKVDPARHTIARAESLANARLLAAAPELLAACEEFVRKVDCGEARSKRSYTQMKAAIAKARGE
jgi:hypothetical protein